MTASLSLSEGTEMELLEQDGAILLRPIKARYRLDHMLKEIRPGNMHDEVQTGAPTGKEAW
jgi:antitoxin component of MazEF toxin-antitoxin module